MNEETRQRLEKLQDNIHQKAEKEQVNYNQNNSLYGMMLMLDSLLREDFTAQQAVNELIANSELEITSEVIKTNTVEQ